MKRYKLFCCLMILFLGGGLLHRAEATPQNISDSALTLGNLSVTAFDDGSVGVQQSGGSTFEDRVESGTDKGSFLRAGASSCGLGFFGTGNASQVSNTTTGRKISTIVNCTALGIQWEQEIFIPTGGRTVFYQWTITNTSLTTVTGLKFFHGQDVFLFFGSNTKPFLNSSADTVGSKFVSSQYEFSALRAITPPTHFDSTSKTAIVASVTGTGDLTDTVDAASGSGVGYALQWDNPSLPAGESWTVRAAEQFARGTSMTGILVTGPIGAPIIAGQTQTIPFDVIEELGVNQPTVNASASTSAAGWSATLTSVSPFSLIANSSRIILVDVSAPLSAVTGVEIPISVTIDTGFIPDTFTTGVVGLDLPTPTPTPTSTSTFTPTSTPTATPTATPLINSFKLNTPKRSFRGQFPVFDGVTNGSEVVTVTVDGTDIGTVTAKSSGSWVLVAPSALGFGPHTVKISTGVATGVTPSTTLQYDGTFVITDGAELDFDGDGLSDITTYSNFGSSVAFRWKRSADDVAVNTMVAGKVPAPGDYDGDGTWDFATIRRDGDKLTWRIRHSADGTFNEISFGLVGDKPLTGCSFLTKNKTVLALVRNDTVVYREEDGPELVSASLKQFGEVVSCLDSDGDDIDEVACVDKSEKGGSKVTVTGVSLDGATVVKGDFTKFDRAYRVRAEPGQSDLAAIIRLVASQKRKVSFVGLSDGLNPEFSLPRKVVVSSGLIPEKIIGFAPNLIWQNLKGGTIMRQAIVNDSTAVEVTKIANRSILLRSQYIYSTKR